MLIPKTIDETVNYLFTISLNFFCILCTAKTNACFSSKKNKISRKQIATSSFYCCLSERL